MHGSQKRSWYGGPIRCLEGRLLRHDPQLDDPYLETDIGQCEECMGKGCGDMPEVLEPGDEVQFENDRGEVIEGIVTQRCEDLDGYIRVRAWPHNEEGWISGWQGRLTFYRPAGAENGWEL